MRRVPHPVVLVFARNKENKLAGLLVSSFCTVTLDPTPIISFNLQAPSSTFDAISASGSFVVASIKSKEIVEGFANLPSKKQKWLETLQNEGLQDVLFGMECEWLREKSVMIGDHYIMVGRVTSLQDEFEEGTDIPQLQLLYSEGKYCHAGEALE